MENRAIYVYLPQINIIMVIFINDKQILADETKSLEAILESENLLQKEGMAVAVNGSIVPR